MSQTSKIEWTDATWNPIRGCSRVSQGCAHCYAERVAARFAGKGQPYEGLAVMKSDGPHWTGKVRLVEELLDWPLRRKKPLRIFVNSMSDLFHESVPDGWIDEVFAVMSLARGHVFQVLTKRPERMRRWFETTTSKWTGDGGEIPGARRDDVTNCALGVGTQEQKNGEQWFSDDDCLIQEERWPLPNVWMGVSVEDQSTADERIPLLLQTPAAVRWISAEPLLGPINLMDTAGDPLGDDGGDFGKTLDWVVCGGESGPGARPMDVQDWAYPIVEQCQAAGVPVFVKQLGSKPIAGGVPVKIGSPKGSRLEEMPGYLRVREFPKREVNA